MIENSLIVCPRLRYLWKNKETWIVEVLLATDTFLWFVFISANLLDFDHTSSYLGLQAIMDQHIWSILSLFISLSWFVGIVFMNNSIRKHAMFFIVFYQSMVVVGFILSYTWTTSIFTRFLFLMLAIYCGIKAK